MMNKFKCIAGFSLCLLGLLIVVGGELCVTAWCIYDLITIVKADTLSFGSCLWLVLAYAFRGVCLGFTGVATMFAGMVLAGITK
jgi:hypothetical protein